MSCICKLLFLFTLIIIIAEIQCSGNEGKKNLKSNKPTEARSILAKARKEKRKMAKKAKFLIEPIKPSVKRFRKKVVKRRQSKTTESNAAKILGNEKKVGKIEDKLKGELDKPKWKPATGHKRYYKRLRKSEKHTGLASNPVSSDGNKKIEKGNSKKFRRRKTRTTQKPNYLHDDPRHLATGSSKNNENVVNPIRSVNTQQRISRKRRRKIRKLSITVPVTTTTVEPTTIRNIDSLGFVATTEKPSRRKRRRKIRKLLITIPVNTTTTEPTTIGIVDPSDFPLRQRKITRNEIPPPEGQPKINPVITLFIRHPITKEIVDAMPIEEAWFLTKCEKIFLSQQSLPKECHDPERDPPGKTNRELTSEEVDQFREHLPIRYNEPEEQYKKRLREYLKKSEHYPG